MDYGGREGVGSGEGLCPRKFFKNWLWLDAILVYFHAIVSYYSVTNSADDTIKY